VAQCYNGQTHHTPIDEAIVHQASPSKGYHRLTRAAALAVTTLASAFAALEVGFRVFPQVVPAQVCQDNHIIHFAYCQWYYQFDSPPRLGYTYEPGFRYEGMLDPSDPALVWAEDETCPRERNDAFLYTMEADEYGFVNPGPWAAEYDVVVTGDSFSQQFAPVWWVDELAGQTGMSVLNLGISGWGPLSEAEAIRRYGLARNPRWIIMLYFEGNDLFNMRDYQAHVGTETDWRTQELRKLPLRERLITPYVLRYWADELLGRNNPPQGDECRYPILVNSNVNQFETVYFDVHIAQLSWSRDEIERSREWRSLSQTLLSLDQEVRAQGARFLLVFAPAKEHIYWGMMWDERDLSRFLELTSPPRSFEEFSQTVDAQAFLMEEFAEAHGIEFVNLVTPLWLAARNEGEIYNYADAHWNSRGNEIVAGVIADYIMAGE
jgi:hypothetical protein